MWIPGKDPTCPHAATLTLKQKGEDSCKGAAGPLTSPSHGVLLAKYTLSGPADKHCLPGSRHGHSPLGTLRQAGSTVSIVKVSRHQSAVKLEGRSRANSPSGSAFTASRSVVSSSREKSS